MPDDIGGRLWNDQVNAASYGGDLDKYQAAVLEQYKLYVELTDRISLRRSLTNTFFLTLNTVIFATLGVVWQNRPQVPHWWVVFPLTALLAQCLVWYWLVRSYRQLNTAKFAVIGAFEERLPASPWVKAEWAALGRGEDHTKYWPVSHLEQWIPVIFAAIYLGGFLAAGLYG